MSIIRKQNENKYDMDKLNYGNLSIEKDQNESISKILDSSRSKNELCSREQ